MRAVSRVLVATVAILCVVLTGSALASDGGLYLSGGPDGVLEYDPQSGSYTVTGGFELEDVDHGVKAQGQTLVYDDKTGTADMKGSVRLLRNETTADADWVVFSTDTNRATMRGNVQVSRVVTGDDGYSLFITCDRFDLSTDTDSFVAEGNVAMERVDKAGKVVTVKADHLEYSGETKIASMSGNVTLTDGERRVECARAEVNTDTNSWKFLGGFRATLPSTSKKTE